MKVHHLNCVSCCPLGGHLMDHGHEGVLDRAHLTSHCLLVETEGKLVLVDTGYGLQEVRNPKSRLSSFFLTMNDPQLKDEMTAFRQIENLGYDPKDVTDIVLTHLDFDHAGGLDDFPWATVHMLEVERDYAFKQKTWLDRQRFRPQQWGTKANWKVYNPDEGDTWFGFSKVSELSGLPPEIALIPLRGHTYGHAGIAVKTNDKWIFDTGDAYFYHQEMNVHNPQCTLGLEAYQTLMEKDRKSRKWNQERLRELKRNHGDQVEIFCSHDVREFERLAGHGADLLVSRTNIEDVHVQI